MRACSFHRLHRCLPVVIVLLLGVLLLSAPAAAEPTKCRAAIAKASAKFVQTRLKALQGCESKIVGGKLPEATVCRTEAKTAKTLARAAAKLRSTVAKACGGKNKTCAVTDTGTAADDALGAIGWDIGTCPDFESSGAPQCTVPLVDCADIGTCLTCVGEAAVDQAVDLYYRDRIPLGPTTAATKPLLKCQQEIGKTTAKLFTARSKALLRCWEKVNKGKASRPCPVPGDGKAHAALAKAEARARDKLCKACGGQGDKVTNATGLKPADGLCDAPGGMFAPAAIGFAATCPALVVPGGEDCGAIGPVEDFHDLLACLVCVTEFKVDCVDRNAVPAVTLGGLYPPECNLVPGPTPSAAVTPVQVETATPVPTITPSPTATANGPQIVSTPITAAGTRYLYRYPVEAIDADVGEILKFALEAAPEGMHIEEETGVIYWTPSDQQQGEHPVIVVVRDRSGLSDSQNFVVAVEEAPNRAPVITTAPPEVLACGPGSSIVAITQSSSQVSGASSKAGERRPLERTAAGALTPGRAGSAQANRSGSLGNDRVGPRRVLALPMRGSRVPETLSRQETPLAQTLPDSTMDRINWGGVSRGASTTAAFTFLIDEVGSGTEKYTTTTISTRQPVTIDLGTVREVDEIQLHLYDDDRFFRYVVEASADGVQFDQIVDRTTGEYRGTQSLVLGSPTSLRYLRIIGTYTSLLNNKFHLIDEIRVIGDAAASPEPVQLAAVDAVRDGTTATTGGQVLELNAGVYRISYLNGAVSGWATDSENGGRTWSVDLEVGVPALAKAYRFGFVHDVLSRYATPEAAAQANAGQSFEIHLPIHARVYFRFPESSPGDNRGTETFQVSQRSGPSSTLLVRVRDAMTRSVLWEQGDVAGSNTWISRTDYLCFACHVQTQASVGLIRSRLKVPDLPVSVALEGKFADAYESFKWLGAQGFSPKQGSAGFFPTTQTSLWAWAVANQDTSVRERLGPSLVRALDWLLTQERPGGGWSDHESGDAQKLYADNPGGVSATHTAGNIEALAKVIQLFDGRNLVPFSDATIDGSRVRFARVPQSSLDIVFPQITGVTGIRLTVSDAFTAHKNFVINEVQAFDGELAQSFASAVANFSQSGFPISPSTINGVVNVESDGWAYSPRNTTTTPAQGLWAFSAAQAVSRVRITQIYRDAHQVQELSLEYTTEPNPTLTSVFQPVPVATVGVYGGETRIDGYVTAIRRNAALLASPSWNFARNVRTAAQTLLGLKAALPFLPESERGPAEVRIEEVATALRAAQQFEGGWSDSMAGIGAPRPFQSAQALEAISLVAESDLDPAVLAGADYLLKTQGQDGSWASPPLERRLAATTWVEIALPTIFDIVAPREPYRYDVDAIDPDGDPVGFELASSPGGMEIDHATGLLTWQPQVGRYSVTVHANDDRGGTGAQTFELSVTRDLDCDGFTAETGDCEDANSTAFPGATEIPGNGVDEDCDGVDLAPVATTTPLATPTPSPSATPGPVSLIVSPRDRVILVGDAQAFLARGSFPDGSTRDVTDEVIWSSSDAGIASVSPDGLATGQGAGVATITASLNALSDSASLTVAARVEDTTLPTVTITAPALDAQLRTPTIVIGTADDANFLRYELALAEENAQVFSTIATGTSPVIDGPLGTLDPTLLPNGVYRMRLTAYDRGGNSNTALTRVSVAGDLKLGNFRVSFTDLTIPVAGIPISITRTYDSLDTSPGDFGAGWRLGYPGQVMDSARETPREAFTDFTRVYVTKPDGRRVGFTFTAQCGFFGCAPSFRADPGVFDTLTSASEALFRSGGKYYGLFSGTYNPSTYVLTTKEKVKYTLDESSGLQRIEDASGNTLSFTPGGIVSSTGVAVTFERDAAGRIRKITEPVDPAASEPPAFLEYQYDANGNLVRFLDQVAHATKYSYADARFPHFLTKIEDPLNRPVTRSVFNDQGQLIGLCDGNGDPATLVGCTKLTPNPDALLQTVVNARGFRTDLLLDARGNVLTERRFLDAATFLDTVRTYDASGNVITETDPEGNVKSYSYDARGNQLTRTEGGRTTTTTYNACDKVVTVRNPANVVETTNDYDATGCNLRFVTNALQHQTEYQYNDARHPTQVTDFFDANRVHWHWSYDGAGFLESMTDSLGKTATYRFSRVGDLLSQIDRKHQEILFTYDDAHRLRTETWDTTPPRVTTYGYNDAGQLTSAADPDSSLTLNYEPATGRLASVDNSGTPGAPAVVVTYGYDGNGNVTEVGDSLGGVTRYEYDALDRLEHIFQSGSGVNEKRVDLSYDGASLLRSLQRFSDLGGTQGVANTTYGYDCGGCADRLASIHHRRAADGSVIHDLDYIRHPHLPDIQQLSDAEGVHTYTYDLTRQLKAAIHPPGGPQPTESYDYDSVGNRTTSHLNTSYTYLPNSNRLGQDSQFVYAYDNNGSLTSRTDQSTGEEETFTYDHRNRLIRSTHTPFNGSNSDVAEYTYDVGDRRIVALESDVATIFVYDGFNPSLKLTRSGQVISRRLYSRRTDQILADDDPVGTRWLLTDQVGTVRNLVHTGNDSRTTYIYDSFGRLVQEASPGETNDLRFTAREFGNYTGVGYFRQRWYLPSLGRFLQEDPLMPFRYDYVSNAPLVNIDPLGLVTLSELLVITEKVAKVSSVASILAPCFSRDPAAPYVAGPLAGALGAAAFGFRYSQSLALMPYGAVIGVTPAFGLEFICSHFDRGDLDSIDPLLARLQDALCRCGDAM